MEREGGEGGHKNLSIASSHVPGRRRFVATFVFKKFNVLMK